MLIYALFAHVQPDAGQGQNNVQGLAERTAEGYDGDFRRIAFRLLATATLPEGRDEDKKSLASDEQYTFSYILWRNQE